MCDKYRDSETLNEYGNVIGRYIFRVLYEPLHGVTDESQAE
jgi:hypothetical protein